MQRPGSAQLRGTVTISILANCIANSGYLAGHNDNAAGAVYILHIIIGAELAGARAPPLFNPRPEIYSIKCA